MQLSGIETFYWIARLGSFRRAAEKLNISQPSVSSRIRTLEDELGVKLLHRNRDLTLTEQGHELLDYAEQILKLTRELTFNPVPNREGDRLRIGANGPVAATWLMGLIDLIEAEFPDLRVEIEVNQSTQLLKHLENGQLDLAFQSILPQDARFRIEQLAAYPMNWAARPGLVSGPIQTEALLEYPVVGYGWESPVRSITDASWFGPQRHRRLLGTDSLFMMIRLAVDGLGLIYVPKVAIQRELSSGQLEAIETEDDDRLLPVFSTIGRKHLTSAMASALAHAKELAGSDEGLNTRYLYRSM